VEIVRETGKVREKCAAATGSQLSSTIQLLAMEDDEKTGNRLEGLLKGFDPEAMSVDELWQVHEQIEKVLCTKILSEQEKLDAQMSRLRTAPARLPELRKSIPAKPAAPKAEPARRPYPEVKPKYCSLKDPSQTWAGRGKQPRWLIAEMKGGKTLDDFLIGAKPAARKKAR